MCCSDCITNIYKNIGEMGGSRQHIKNNAKSANIQFTNVKKKSIGRILGVGNRAESSFDDRNVNAEYPKKMRVNRNMIRLMTAKSNNLNNTLQLQTNNDDEESLVNIDNHLNLLEAECNDNSSINHINKSKYTTITNTTTNIGCTTRPVTNESFHKTTRKRRTSSGYQYRTVDRKSLNTTYNHNQTFDYSFSKNNDTMNIINERSQNQNTERNEPRKKFRSICTPTSAMGRINNCKVLFDKANFPSKKIQPSYNWTTEVDSLCEDYAWKVQDFNNLTNYTGLYADKRILDDNDKSHIIDESVVNHHKKRILSSVVPRLKNKKKIYRTTRLGIQDNFIRKNSNDSKQSNSNKAKD